jgi:hypothetical protein
MYIYYFVFTIPGKFRLGVLHSSLLKGSVQRKLRWVKNGVNRSVGASDCGAGQSFIVLFGFQLDFAIFPFPVSIAQIIGKFWKNR